MRGIHIFEKPYYREIRPMRGRPMRGPPVAWNEKWKTPISLSNFPHRDNQTLFGSFAAVCICALEQNNTKKI